MSALLRKDRPWRVGLSIAGAIAFAGAIWERSFVGVFLVPTDQYDALYHVAWIAGLLLGSVAACYDELLGTREFLHQRPVARSRLAAVRLVGCAIALLSWLLCGPVIAWCGYALFDVDFHFTFSRGLPGLWGTGLVAISAAAIGCFAGAMPAPWWLRLGTAGALLVGAFLAIDGLSFDAERVTDAATFVGGHLALALGLFWAAHVAMQHDADPDRPWPQGLRLVVAGPAALALALVGLMVFAEAEADAVQRLHRVYPSPALHGGRVVLVAPEPGHARRIVDATHEPLGEQFTGDEVWLPRDLPRSPSVFRGFERPRWSNGQQYAWLGSFDRFWTGMLGRVLLASDGEVWCSSPGRAAMERTGKGEQREPFAPRSEMRRIDFGKVQAVVVRDFATAELWRFDPERRHFVPAPLPAGDRFVRFASGNDRLLAALAASSHEQVEDARHLDLVEGQRALYALTGDAWRAVAPVSVLAESAWPRAELLDADPLAPVLEIRTAADGITWRHDFAPRTVWERVHAGTAMFWSLWRAPVVQVAAHLAGASESLWSRLEDPLIAGGRRGWLVLACLGLVAWLAWRVHRRLLAFAAPSATRWFWTGAVVLLGPAAVIACLLFERPRAYARRQRTEPFPSPRIVTPAPGEALA